MLPSVGQARVGYDTLIESGSRLATIALNLTYLGEGYLGPPATYTRLQTEIVKPFLRTE